MQLDERNSMKPEDLKYAKTHEWVAVDGDTATIGITDFAVQLLTDIVYLSLPTVGKKFAPGESMGEIESVKAVSDIYAPVRGEIVAVNQSLPDNLALLSDSPFEKAWIAKLRIADPTQLSQLMNRAEYLKHCEKDHH